MPSPNCTLPVPHARKRVEKEDDLVNHRMSWCVGSNSFLLASYMLAHNLNVGELAKNIIPIAGILLTTSFMLSIFAAWSAIWHWRKCAKGKHKEYLFSPFTIAFFGSIPSVCAPTALLLIWIILANKVQSLAFATLILPLITACAGAVWFCVFFHMDKSTKEDTHTE